jgi:glycerol uptake facilitator-like aquaporin
VAAQHLFLSNSAFGVLASTVATAGALVGLIFAFGAVSGGHFNPLITALQWLAHERKLNCTLAYVVAQCMGAVIGVLLMDFVFGAGPPFVHARSVNWLLCASEVVATAGLMIVVFGCARSGRTDLGPLAVGAWLTAAILATPSASFANPALAVAAIYAAGPIGLSAHKAFFYVVAEVVGALLAARLPGINWQLITGILGPPEFSPDEAKLSWDL